MALKVWLPLDGNLENKGVSNAIFTGSPTYTSGKIGQCLSNGTITCTNTTIPITISTATQYSMCSWVKMTSTSTWVWSMGTGTGATRGLWIGGANTGPFFAYSGSGAFTGSKVINDGNWHHVCFTVNGAISRAYVDGIDCGGSSNTKTDAVDSNTINIYANDTQSINDFRIYDHCLSAAEVHEISQGLVLHYKLDDITNGIKDSSGYGHNGNYVNTTNSSDTAHYSASIACIGTTVDNSSNTIDGAQFFYCNMEMPPMNTITVTWWGKNITYGRGGIFETSNTIQTDTNKGTDYNTTAFANWDSTFGIYNGSTRVNIFPNFKLDGMWHYHTITFDSANVRYYLDGVIKQTSALMGSLPAWNSFCIGLGRAGGVWRQIEQNVSDFRIYCTALSADDILQLYHTSAKVDNKQNLHTFELVENNSKIQINKRGQTLCNELEEDAAIKFYKTNQIIETNEIIEF